MGFIKASGTLASYFLAVLSLMEWICVMFHARLYHDRGEEDYHNPKAVLLMNLSWVPCECRMEKNAFENQVYIPYLRPDSSTLALTLCPAQQLQLGLLLGCSL